MNYKNIENTIYEEYTEALLNILDEFNNISFILSNDKALDLVDEMESLGCKFNQEDTFSFKEFEEIYNTDILLVSKYSNYGKEYYSLESAYGNDHLKAIEEQDIVFVEEDLIDPDELNEYIDCPIATLTETEYLDEVDEADEELFEDLTQEIIDDIIDNQGSNDFCLHCAILDGIRESYEIGYRACLIDNDLDD